MTSANILTTSAWAMEAPYGHERARAGPSQRRVARPTGKLALLAFWASRCFTAWQVQVRMPLFVRTLLRGRQAQFDGTRGRRRVPSLPWVALECWLESRAGHGPAT
jgi:hypothetical protein